MLQTKHTPNERSTTQKKKKNIKKYGKNDENINRKKAHIIKRKIRTNQSGVHELSRKKDKNTANRDDLVVLCSYAVAAYPRTCGQDRGTRVMHQMYSFVINKNHTSIVEMILKIFFRTRFRYVWKMAGKM